MTGGFPLSACVGQSACMDAWPVSDGEAIHTSTFLGHPVGCAMALAQIQEIRRLRLVGNSARLGKTLLADLAQVQAARPGLKCQARGIGLMAGLEFQTASGAPATEVVIRLMKRLLRAGYIVLPEGEHSNVIGFTPPLIISESQVHEAVGAVQAAVREL